MRTPAALKIALEISLMVALMTASICGVGGCVSTQYDGSSRAATARVEVYPDVSQVSRPFEVLGTATARGGESLPRHAIEADLIREGQARGADAVVIVRDEMVVIGTAARVHRDGPQAGQAYEAPVRERVLEANLIRYTGGSR
jgi:hypothetical protein